MKTTLLLLLLAQTTGPDLGPPAPGAVAPEVATAEGLRQNIRDLRMNLLLGGDRVRSAEREAMDFYRSKAEFVDGRLDTVDSELSERRATYEVALDRALGAPSPDDRAAAFREAQPLRATIAGLEAEAEDLVQKRSRLAGLADRIAERDRERERLVEQLESAGAVDASFGLPSLGVGLAPPALPPTPSSPLEDVDLLEDLFARDPAAARSLVWDLDPVGYFEVFPLEPPAGALRRALVFPPADLPGER